MHLLLYHSSEYNCHICSWFWGHILVYNFKLLIAVLCEVMIKEAYDTAQLLVQHLVRVHRSISRLSVRRERQARQQCRRELLHIANKFLACSPRHVSQTDPLKIAPRKVSYNRIWRCNWSLINHFHQYLHCYHLWRRLYNFTPTWKQPVLVTGTTSCIILEIISEFMTVILMFNHF